MVCVGRLVAMVSQDPYSFKAGVVQHSHEFIPAVVFELLNVNLFLEQLPVLPQPCRDLARGDLLQGIHRNCPGRQLVECERVGLHPFSMLREAYGLGLALSASSSIPIIAHHSYDHISLFLPGFDVPVGLGCLFQWIAPVYDRP